ncbi:MAG: nickel-dependent lactate racemase [Eubacteriales bacterium]|nr:nickel-dependent lactate racemase [Eubacteriales bacterium]
MTDGKAKQVNIPYGCTRLAMDLEKYPAKAILTVNPDTPHGMSVPESLMNPIGSERLSALAKDAGRLLILTSDQTRPLPSKQTLPYLIAEARAENPALEIRILIATGCHRAMTYQEMEERFGADLIVSEHFVCHNAEDKLGMTFKGILPSGGELWMNSLVDWADIVVAEGFIEPHLFAGFSGGRKSVLPGICSYKTVCGNHCSAFVNIPQTRPGNLTDNPMHMDMLFAAQQAKLAFILNVVLDDAHRIIASFAGDSVRAHMAGCDYVTRRQAIAPVEGDIVVTTNNGYPLDQNFYQSIKGLISAERCVREGGVTILVAECLYGHGSDGFFSFFTRGLTHKQIFDEISSYSASETVLDQWQAQTLTRVCMKCSIIVVTLEQNRDMIRQLGLTWASNLDEALGMAYRKLGEDASLVVIPEGVSVIFT